MATTQQCGLGNTERVAQLTLLESLHAKKKRVVLLHSANGCEHLCAVTEEGELYTCGYSSHGQTGHGIATQYVLTPRLVDRLSSHRVLKVACSYYHTCRWSPIVPEILPFFSIYTFN